MIRGECGGFWNDQSWFEQWNWTFSACFCTFFLHKGHIWGLSVTQITIVSSHAVVCLVFFSFFAQDLRYLSESFCYPNGKLSPQYSSRKMFHRCSEQCSFKVLSTKSPWKLLVTSVDYQNNQDIFFVERHTAAENYNVYFYFLYFQHSEHHKQNPIHHALFWKANQVLLHLEDVQAKNPNSKGQRSHLSPQLWIHVNISPHNITPG